MLRGYPLLLRRRGIPPPAQECRALGAHAALRGGPPLPLGLVSAVRPLRPRMPAGMGGPPPPGMACHALGAHVAVPGGLPPLPGSDRARFARAAGAGGPRPGPGPRLPGGSRWCVLRGSPPCSCYAPLARAAGRRVPLPLPPLSGRSRYARAAVWGRPSSLSFLLGAPALCARTGDPLLGLVAPFAGSPSAPSLHAVGARCWVGAHPLPSPPCWPLAISAHGRSGGTLSAITSSAVSAAALSLLGVSSLPPNLCAVPFNPGPLSAIFLSAVFAAAFLLLKVSSPPSDCCAASRDGAGLALTGPPAGAAGAAPVGCAGKYPASLFFPPWLERSPPTEPPTAALVGCAAGCPAPPAPVSVLNAGPAVPIDVAPCGAAPSPPSVGCSWVGRLGVGFCLLPPAPVRSPPARIETLWGIPGFHIPWGPRLLWGSSRPMTTRPPLRLSVESSHPAMT